MKISTRGRYAIRVMIDLAEHDSINHIPLKDVVLRQEISQKYLESIMNELSKKGLVDGQHGKGGGYKLVKNPEYYTVGEILRATEGDLAPVSCLEDDAKPCPKMYECRTISMWKNLYKLINNYFDGIKLSDLTGNDKNDHII